MIPVTLLSKQSKRIYINPHQIEYIEERVEGAVIVLLSGKHLSVQETYEILFKRIVKYRRLIGAFKNEE